MARGTFKLTVLLMPRAYIGTKGLVEGILNENVNREIILCGSKGLVDDCNLAKFGDDIRFFKNNTISFEALLSILTDAKGEYVCFYDEICLDKQIRLQTQCNYLDNNREIDAVSCGYEILDGNSEAKANTINALNLLDLYKSDYFPYFSFVYRKSVLLSLISDNALQFMTFKSLYGLSNVLLAMFCMSKFRCGYIEDTLCSKKQLLNLVNEEYKAFTESDEFLLRGGFGEIDVESDFSSFALNNCKCSLNNCNCYYNPSSGPIDNCSCSYLYDASSNNCDCNTTGTTKPTKPTPSVDPTITPTSFL